MWFRSSSGGSGVEKVGVACGAVQHRSLAARVRREERREERRPGGKGDSNSHGARPVHLIITMIKWTRTSGLPIKNSFSVRSSPSYPPTLTTRRRERCTCQFRPSRTEASISRSRRTHLRWCGTDNPLIVWYHRGGTNHPRTKFCGALVRALFWWVLWCFHLNPHCRPRYECSYPTRGVIKEN